MADAFVGNNVTFSDIRRARARKVSYKICFKFLIEMTFRYKDSRRARSAIRRRTLQKCREMCFSSIRPASAITETRFRVAYRERDTEQQSTLRRSRKREASARARDEFRGVAGRAIGT